MNDAEQRGIAIATSKPMGRSQVHFPEREVKNRRMVMELDKGWKTWLCDKSAYGHTDNAPTVVDIPHNWDDYYGYRQLTHGNLHGTAMYEKTFTLDNSQFPISDSSFGKRYFLRFEGVGTYATVTLNGKDFGRHPVGRTTLTLDVTEALKPGENRLVVKAEHPE